MRSRAGARSCARLSVIQNLDIRLEMKRKLSVKPASECQFDFLALGEIMLRLDPGDRRVHTTRHFNVWEGGGEYNVGRGLRRCFGMRAAVVSAFADNPVGRLLEDLILQGGVDMSHCIWRKYDGIGRGVRNGLNFTEAGFGVRGAVGCSDRGHTAVSQLKPGDIDWEYIFGEQGVRWFHTGGIFAALGEHTPEVAIEAIACAKKHGTVTSYDLNFRPSLWDAFGGTGRAAEVNRKIVGMLDVLIGNEEDFTMALGFKLEGLDEDYKDLDVSAYQNMYQDVMTAFPDIKVLATTLRQVKSASVNDWSAIGFDGDSLYQSNEYKDLLIYDRVGGGDSFCSGLVYGLMTGMPLKQALDYGAAHGALAMTTPGDTTMARLNEVQSLASGGSARVKR